MKTIIWNNLEKKGELFMLEFLQTGKMLYVLAAICALGVVSKLATSSLYKRLIKETGNMALTKNKNLKSLKQKTENMFLLNHGIRNTTAYIEKQIYGFRFMKVSLDNWDNLSMQAMILSFLVGGAAAFGSYWFRTDSYFIVLYGAAGILSGLFLVFMDNGANISAKRQQLSDCLVDYVENSPHFYKNVEKSAEQTEPEKKGKIVAVEPVRPRVRELRRQNGGDSGRKELAEEAAAADKTERAERNFDRDEAMRSDKTERGDRNFDRSAERGGDRIAVMEPESILAPPAQERLAGKISILSRKKDKPQPHEQEARRREPEREKPAPQQDELGESIELLRQSLEQIAASQENTRRQILKSQEKPKRELRPEELKLLGEILQDYLS